MLENSGYKDVGMVSEGDSKHFSGNIHGFNCLFFYSQFKDARDVLKNDQDRLQEDRNPVSPCPLRKESSRGPFPWMEVNSGCPLVISVTVVALGPWELRFTVSRQLSASSQYCGRATTEILRVVSWYSSGERDDSPVLQRESLLSLYSTRADKAATYNSSFTG